MSFPLILAALNDSSRRSLYERLLDAPCSVGELTQTLGISQSSISQHLKVLREAGMVRERREGQRRIYQAKPEALDALQRYLLALHPSHEVESSVDGKRNVSMLANEIERDALQWADEWPGQDAQAYSITHRMLHLGRYLERNLKEVASRNGLLGGELLLLDALTVSAHHTSTPSKLQRRLGVSKGGITGLLDSLEAQALVTRIACEQDRRVSLVTLSQKGHQLQEHILVNRDYGPEFAAIQSLKPEDRADLARLLRTLHETVDEAFAQQTTGQM
ncbi:ArsR family transcriptional regulator [Pseudomonas sp. CG7]|uniref:metalloregulator ArsR/SmtB family transcription factor n=1 Tax=Pseudomonas sp. CG7 TaxID=191007 RepID=UPI002033CEF6|nr:metalloregulator ArsR/SmtB family transcription factor [Pseudomonas sp. CG7]MCM2459400.1 ArsR family transcriptional regulator [Pseudomonas sp. CG7]